MPKNPRSYISTNSFHKLKHLNLAKERYWRLLLHYRQELSGGYLSEVDDPGFFLSPNGKTNPQAELEATLTYFFSDELVGRSKQPAQCAFVARFHWLQQQLQFDRKQLPFEPCQRFRDWLTELNPASISLIFPSAFMDNPVSMFGHTFLRIDQRGQTDQTKILAYTINYAADVPPDVGMEFMYKGIFGGYRGVFSTMPYYIKVQEYRDIENRDIWEYQLNLSPDAIHRLLMHTWEMGNAYFDYFFFKENCAYHILSLLEIADPKLHLTERFQFWTIPADTIRLLTQRQELIQDISYRSARSTQLRRKREALQDNEALLLNQLVTEPFQLNQPEFRQLPQDRQIYVLDVASDLLRYKNRTESDKAQAQKYSAANRSVLATRSRIKSPSPPFPIKPLTLSPEQGHETVRIGIGLGWRNDEIFEHMAMRGVYHDLLDPDPGYTMDSQIELGSLELRHYHGRNNFRIERLAVANIISLAPIDSWFQWPSWKISLEMNTVKTSSCDLCTNGHFNTGAGGAFETNFFQREVFFLFGEIDANVSEGYEEIHRVGGGVSGGVSANITENWKWLVSAGYLVYPLGDQSDDVPISVGQRWTLAKNLSLRTSYTHHDRDNEFLCVLHGYF